MADGRLLTREEDDPRGRPSASRLAVALLPAVLLPLLAALFYFVLFSAHPAARLLYGATKVFTALWPLLAVRFVLGEPFPGPRAGLRRWLRALPLGLLAGLVVGSALVGLMATPAGAIVSASAETIRAKATQLGILEWYWPFALFLSLEPISKIVQGRARGAGRAGQGGRPQEGWLPFKGGQHGHAKPAARARRDGAGRAPGFVISLIR